MKFNLDLHQIYIWNTFDCRDCFTNKSVSLPPDESVVILSFQRYMSSATTDSSNRYLLWYPF